MQLAIGDCPEQYIWTKEDAIPERSRATGDWLAGQDKELGHHYFRRTFQVEHVPPSVTLYIAGPRSANIYLNGQLVHSFQLNLDSPISIRDTLINFPIHSLRE